MKWRVAFLIWGVVTISISSCASVPPSRDEVGVYHTVEKGQTLWRIAKSYGVSMEAIKEVNKIEDETRIFVGQKIFIPGATKVLPVEAYIPEITEQDFIWPLKGKIIREFGLYKGVPRPGIDISAPAGSEVVAAMSGRVIFSNFLKGYRMVIIIDHLNGFTTCYAGELIPLVKIEDQVNKGQTIARLESSSPEEEPFLHFQLRIGDKPHNPRFYLPALPGV